MTRLIFRSCLNIDVGSGEERINPNLNQIDDDIHETGSGHLLHIEIQTSWSYTQDNNIPQHNMNP